MLGSSTMIFLSTLSLRRATAVITACPPLPSYFYPRSPCGERPLAMGLSTKSISISIHALLAESDCNRSTGCPGRPRQFLSTLSLRRATCQGYAGVINHDISIHALLAESDVLSCGWCGVAILFLSTLSLRRATIKSTLMPSPTKSFLSTLSLRRATTGVAARNPEGFHFYPRSPCGERPVAGSCRNGVIGISIHALLAESDVTWYYWSAC